MRCLHVEAERPHDQRTANARWRRIHLGAAENGHLYSPSAAPASKMPATRTAQICWRLSCHGDGPKPANVQRLFRRRRRGADAGAVRP